MKVNVLHCLESFRIGGTETQAVRLITNLDREKYNVHVAVRSGEGPLISLVESHGIPITEFPIKSFRSLRFIKQVRRLAGYLMENKIHILHCHDYPTNILGLAAGTWARTPIRISSRREMGTRTFKEKVLQRLVWAGAHKIIVNSKAVKDLIIHKEFVPADRVEVIYNCIEADKVVTDSEEIARKRSDLALKDYGPLIGSVANFYDWKDHESLLKAISFLVSKFPLLRLVLIGDGPERENILNLALQLGIREHVVMLGQRLDIYEIVGMLDVAVLSSITEGFSNAILEYMAAGRPIVATRTGGNVDAIDDGINGFLVPVKSPDRLSACIRELLLNRELADKLGIAAKKKVISKFTLNALVNRTQEIYASLLEDRLATKALTQARHENLV